LGRTLDFKGVLDAKGGNSFVNWFQAGRKYKNVLTAVLQAKIHVIVCLRVKVEYILEVDLRGKQSPRKVGSAPICRDGTEYEFSAVFDGDAEHYATASKDRTGLFLDQRFQITEETGTLLLEWLNSAPLADPEPSPQEHLAAELANVEPEILAAYLTARGLSSDGTIEAVSDSYAQKALAALPRLKEGIEKFRQEASQNGEAEPAHNIPEGMLQSESIMKFIPESWEVFPESNYAAKIDGAQERASNKSTTGNDMIEIKLLVSNQRTYTFVYDHITKRNVKEFALALGEVEVHLVTEEYMGKTKNKV
jgi:hypothetical protein